MFESLTTRKKRMFDELIFTGETPAKDDAYIGGGACLSTDLAWPCSTESDGLMLLEGCGEPSRDGVCLTECCTACRGGTMTAVRGIRTLGVTLIF